MGLGDFEVLPKLGDEHGDLAEEHMTSKSYPRKHLHTDVTEKASKAPRSVLRGQMIYLTYSKRLCIILQLFLEPSSFNKPTAMTNIFGPKKHERKQRLFEIAVETLQKQGWTIAKEKLGKSSVRRITKNGDSKLISIRTTQDQWIAFPPKPDRQGWITLDDVDVVVAVSVDENDPPREAQVHWLPADDMRKRFGAALKARVAANRVQPVRRGVWIPLYAREEDNPENVSYIGGGAGLDFPAIARVPMSRGGTALSPVASDHGVDDGNDGELLTIAEAKRRLARTLGVNESSIKIIVEA